jgi:putative DNA primase/helicase
MSNPQRRTAKPKLLPAALAYAARGWAVFPLKPREKTPIYPGGFKIATKDPDQIRQWWTSHPHANIGIATGAHSGIDVIDVDVKKKRDGEASLRLLCNGHRSLPPTLEARTPSGGRHLIFVECNLRCSSDKLGSGLDIRAEGGYIVAAPSVTEQGSYRWLNKSPIASFPDWFMEETRPSTSKPNDSTTVPPVDIAKRVERLREALKFLNAAADDREFWLKVGWAIARDTVQSQDGFDLWLEWSAQSSAHDPLRDPTLMRVEYFKKSSELRSNPVTVATIFGRAYEAGYRPRRPCTELGNAERFGDAAVQTLRYCPQVQRWLVWNEHRWCFDEDGAALRLAKAVARNIYDEAHDEPDESRRAALGRWAAASESSGQLNAAVTLAQTDERLLVDVSELDSDQWLLGVQNGVLDLRTGALLPPKPELYLTKQAQVEFDPQALCPRWIGFLDRIFAGDAPLISYIQRAIGYSLTGDTMAKTLFFMHGPRGDNGKSTLIETLLSLFGDYGLKTRSEILMRRKDGNDNGATPDRVALRGARLVVAAELSDRQQLDETFLKDVTGGIDRISARDLYQRSISFKPEFKLWLYGNHKPRLRADDDAAWRRIHLIPFEERIPLAEQDPTLGQKLTQEFPGILNWALVGLAECMRGGLAPPEKVLAAVAAYHTEMDTIGRFLSERCELASEGEVRTGDLYRAYKAWIEENGERPLGNPRFSQELSGRGFKSRTLHGGRIWLCISLRQGGH